MIDSEQIFEVLPKTVHEWTASDVSVWLRMNFMENHIEQFKNMKIDGPAMIELTPKKLNQQFQISSNFMIKNIIDWVMNRRFDFDEFVFEQRAIMDKENIMTQQKEVFPFSDKETPQINVNPLKTFIQKKPQYVQFAASKLIIGQHKTKTRVLLSYLKKTSKIPEVSKIGRLNTNDIIINEESVSRYHAEITPKGNEFYLKDVGSKYGTFYHVDNRKAEILQGRTFFLGTLELIVIELIIVKKEKQNSLFSLKLSTTNCSPASTISILNKVSADIGNNIGKKDVSITDDSLKNMHARVFLNDQTVWMQQLDGEIYVKLERNQEFPISEDRMYKFGGLDVRLRLEEYCQQCKQIPKRCGC